MTGLAGKTLLTGATGFIGSSLRATLEASGSCVIAPDRATLDLTNQSSVSAFLAQEPVQTILHLASRGVTSNPFDPSLVAEECQMVQALCEGLPEGGTFFYAGSMSEYGRSGHLMEEMDCTPQNAYARGKLEAGLWLRRHGPERGITPIVGRIFGAYGPGEGPKRLFPQVISRLQAGEAVDLSDGMQVRDFVHVKDIARAVMGLVRLETPPDCVNLGTGIGMQVRAVVERLGEELGAAPDQLRFGARARSPHDLQTLVASTRILQGALGWSPPQRLEADQPILSLIAPERLSTVF